MDPAKGEVTMAKAATPAGPITAAANELAAAVKAYSAVKQGDVVATREAYRKVQAANDKINAIRNTLPDPKSLKDPVNKLWGKFGELGNLIERDGASLSNPKVKKLTRELDRSMAKPATKTAKAPAKTTRSGLVDPIPSKMTDAQYAAHQADRKAKRAAAVKANMQSLVDNRQAQRREQIKNHDNMAKQPTLSRMNSNLVSKPTSNTARRIATAASTRKMVAEGKLPGSWTSAKERALAANSNASARTVKVAERMLADPNKAAKTLEAVQRGATTAARVKAGKFGLALAAGTAIAAGVAALTSRKAKAAEPPAQSGGDRTKPYTDSLGREYKQGRKITRGTP